MHNWKKKRKQLSLRPPKEKENNIKEKAKEMSENTEREHRWGNTPNPWSAGARKAFENLQEQSFTKAYGNISMPNHFELSSRRLGTYIFERL